MRTKFAALALGALLATGCLSPEEKEQVRQEIASAQAQIDALTAQAHELHRQYQAGEIGLDDYMAALATINQTIAVFQDVKQGAEDKIKDWTDFIDYVITAVGAIGGTTVLSRWSRGVRGWGLVAPARTRKKEED